MTHPRQVRNLWTAMLGSGVLVAAFGLFADDPLPFAEGICVIVVLLWAAGEV